MKPQTTSTLTFLTRNRLTTLLCRGCWVALIVAGVNTTNGQGTLVTPARGGGLDTASPMIHVDIFYDFALNQMQATVAPNSGIPRLVALPEGYAFDSAAPYSVLSGKAYNFQYAWNFGALFSPPTGAAVWIERLSASPGLENYDGPGNKNENPPRSWAPILGTAGSPPIWQWYGRMAHNAYAIANPTTDTASASFRVYFGDIVTGSRDAFASYDDAIVTLDFGVQLTPVPEPGTGALLGVGLLALLAGVARRRRQS